MHDYTVGKIENLGEAMAGLNDEATTDLDTAKAYVLDALRSGDFDVKEMRKLAETYAILCSTECGYGDDFGV